MNSEYTPFTWLYVPVRIAARGRCTERVGDEAVVEAPAVFGDLVDTRRPIDDGPVGADRVRGVIVGQDEDDVGALVGRGVGHGARLSPCGDEGPAQPARRARAAALLSSQLWSMNTPFTSTPPADAPPPPPLSAATGRCLGRSFLRGDLGGLLGFDRLAVAGDEELVVLLGPHEDVVIDVARSRSRRGNRTQ